MITLKNLWQHKDTIMLMWMKKKDNLDQFARLINCSDYENTFKNVILDNFKFLVENDIINEKRFCVVGDFVNGLCKVRKDLKYGYIDENGDECTGVIFDSAKPFYNDFAPVRLGDKWGYLKKDGSWLIPPMFDDAEDFKHDVAKIRIGNHEFNISLYE